MLRPTIRPPTLLLALGVILPATPQVMAQETVEQGIVVAIREEGFRRSQVMEMASMMTDVFGPRYANSPAYDAACRWAEAKFKEFGLDATVEAWGEYGFGWENTYTSVHLLEPQYQPIIAYPIPSTRGTSGVVRSVVVAIDVSQLQSEADLDVWRGKLRDKIVFTEPARDLVPNFNPQAVRLSDEELRDMARLDIGRLEPDQAGTATGRRGGSRRRGLSRERIAEFFEDEGAAVLVRAGRSNVGPMDKGVVAVSGSGPLPLDATPPTPAIVMAAEHYNRVLRVMEHGIAPTMEVEIRNTLHDDDPLDYNVLASLPGSDLASEIVMIGAHFDGEPAGTGATDNASGSAMVMEAMRILQAIEAKPRRTIRAALWGAEESGLLGSRGYVGNHFGDPETRLPEHDKLSVYFNVDWYGRFRGIYLQGNDAARPIFDAWMKPFHDVGMSWIVPGNTGGSDHMAFLEVGLPGFQFIQDDLEFFNVTFHTNMDVYDRLIAEDLQQGAVVLASFAYHAAMRDGEFPYADGIDNGRRWHK